MGTQSTSAETPKVETAKTSNETLAKIGKDALAKSPALKAVYVTSDGFVFANESDAKNNAKTLKDQAIQTVKRVEEKEETAKTESK